MKIELNELLAAMSAGKTAEVDAQKLREEMAAMATLLERTGFDNRYPKLFNDVAEYAAKVSLGIEPRGLLLIGNCGCGKTEAVRRLAAILKIEFLTTGEIMEKFGGDEYYTAIRQPNFFSRKPGALIVDELGTEPIPYTHFGTRYNVMAEVLQERYNGWKFHGARTIITSNLPLEKLNDLYGERVESRFWESFVIKSYKGCDFRKPPRREES